ARGNVFPDVAQLVKDIDLNNSTVQSVHLDDVALIFNAGGVAELLFHGEPVTVGHVILADDAAILTHLPEAARPSSLRVLDMTAPPPAQAPRLPAPIRRSPDRGVTMVQRKDLSVLGFITGPNDVEVRLASTLNGPFPLARIGTSRFRRLVPADGVP